ncbi:adenylate/guanylate cyclase domain-containing protein [Mesorhizobium sp. M0586]|uniref:adenylate/guanylate cyclase domain-containing protein n=1 Tax=unclassified Mesorhizobium TaxID=325217 RepID=UPI003336F0E1
MDQETLLAAVLLADVVGSTPLYERIGDDAALQQVSDCLDTMREIVAKHRGDFIYSKGDDILSLFESPEMALRAVCQITHQLTKGPLSARIGLHFGAVIRARGAIFGDVVNVTARLSTTANPGEVLISQSFCEALSPRSRKGLRLLDKMALKGKQEFFDVYTCGATMGAPVRRSPAMAPLQIDARSCRGRFIWSSATEISCDPVETANP